MTLCRLLFFAVIWVSMTATQGAAADSERSFQFECRWAETAPQIDGTANEAVWQTAEEIDHFFLPWLKKEDRRPPKTATKARLLWDRDYLYFFATMQDGDLFADIRQHDGMTWHNDVFELFFKPAADKTGYYEFQVNAAGTVMDMLIPQRGPNLFEKNIKDGDFHIDAKVKLDGTLDNRKDRDRGWSVEGRIPWNDFLRTGGRPQIDEVWKFALCRYDYDNTFEAPDLSTCANLSSKPHADFHLHEDYAALKFVPSKSMTERSAHGLKPYVTTSRVTGSPEPPPPYRAERVLSKIATTLPIYIASEPGSSRLYLIDQTKTASGASRLIRTTETPETGEVEELLSFDGTAYSLTFHPDFAKNGYLYVGWNSPQEGTPKKCMVTRWTIDRKAPHGIVPDSKTQIIEWESNGHNGAAVAFGLDGMLYVTSGDGTSDSDTNLTGQGLDHLLAKLLRIDVDHPAPGQNYSVPKDNPFVGQKDVRPETFAYGFRNPWRIAVDPNNGNIFVGNNGQDLWEQVYLIERGANYGWSVYEGGQLFYATRKLGPTPVSKPIFDHPHSEARSLTGGVVYPGKKLPELTGAYLYGDYSTGKVWAAKFDGRKVLWHREIADTALQISGFGLDGQGELLICDHRGKDDAGIYTLIPETRPFDPTAFPRKLSQSGLFKAVKEHRMEEGVIPYSVNAPLWSDGTHKARFMALPASTKNKAGQEEPTVISIAGTKSWDLPNQTVLVKSFAIEREEGNPSSRQWIETRFLTKQGSEWVGYSYLWNDDQSDAELVDVKGADREYSIRTANGSRKLAWHYPSRAECMVCHSRASKFVLGLSTPQMNRDHDYGDGAVENQLSVLEKLGLIRTNYRSDVLDHVKKQLVVSGLPEKDVNDRFAAQTTIRNQRGMPGTNSLLSFAPENYPKLADPYDSKAELAARARAYLHANCSICHVEAGGGNAQMQLEFTTTLEKMKVINEAPLHHTFGIEGAKLIAPGAPDRSVLLARIARRGQGQMPQLATTIVDEPAVAMIRDWIKSLPASSAVEAVPTGAGKK